VSRLQLACTPFSYAFISKSAPHNQTKNGQYGAFFLLLEFQMEKSFEYIYLAVLHSVIAPDKERKETNDQLA
jgi:hypothetical protein